ncbi:J domain-containing protein [Zooshikella harenae]|uniref:J domain-containing protein n=1 Tax=Zooshikella harenae TaxID=2827238 RepID=A0ABS5ZFH0_9GAMM|nr:J domain-containing protein [Zooshikella harenae]MBU2712809.1 J domain-containing protein [Zooshikella harenae]
MTTLTITDIATKSASKTATSKEWKKLQNLWSEIEKKQARNLRYEKKLADFFDEFKEHVQTLEQGLCVAMEKYIRHLLTFVSRKTIKGSQREMLYAWIEEELSTLEANPFRQFSTDPLREDFHQTVLNFTHKPLQQLTFDAEEFSYLREELADFIGKKAFQISDEELTDLLKEPSALKNFIETYMQEDPHAFDDEAHEDIDWDTFDNEHFNNRFSEQRHQPTSEKGLAFFKDKEITKLYRQLANRFHPDKELNPEKKEQKKILMQQLSQAKKEKDTVAMIILAQTHLPDFEFKLDKQTFTGLQAALQDKITQLNQAYYQLQQGSDIQSQAWQKFGGGNKYLREKNITEYASYLGDQAEQLEQEIAELKTVKAMQVALRNRLNQESLYELFADEIFG